MVQQRDQCRDGVDGLLLERGLAGTLPYHVATILAGAAKAGRSAPSRSAICEWCALHREGGITALLPDHKGRVVEAAGWWGPALEYFNVPSKPDMSAVYRRLVEVDHFAVTYDQVRGYLTGVPAMLTSTFVAPQMYTTAVAKV